jgi:hypothetical protein
MAIEKWRRLSERHMWILLLSFIALNLWLYKSAFRNHTIATNILTVVLLINLLLLGVYVTCGKAFKTFRIIIGLLLASYLGWIIFRTIQFYFGGDA